MKVRRVEPVDRLTRPEGTALLYERILIRLSPLAEEIFDASAEAISVQALAERLEAVFGAPEGDVEAVTQRAVDELVEQGVLAEQRETRPCTAPT